MGLAESSAPVGMLVQCHDVGVKRSFDPFDTGLLRTACSHNPQKHSQSAHFSAKNGFLLMFLAGPKIKNLHASKLASDFQPFAPGIITYYCITGPRSKEPRFAGNKVFFLPFAGKNGIIMKNVIIY